MNDKQDKDALGLVYLAVTIPLVVFPVLYLLCWASGVLG